MYNIAITYTLDIEQMVLKSEEGQNRRIFSK